MASTCTQCKEHFEGEYCPTCYPVAVVIDESAPAAQLANQRVDWHVNIPTFGQFRTKVSQKTADDTVKFLMGALVAVLGFVAAFMLGVRPPPGKSWSA